MARVFGLTLLLVALAIGAALYLRQSTAHSPAGPAIAQAEAQAQSAVAGTNFQGAVPLLQAWYAEYGTYAGATLPPATGVLLVRADTTGYCLQSGAGTAVEHEVGPNGQPQPGPC
jgi:hypothetical protein